MDRHESFNYAIFPSDESELLGCFYIDPVPTGDGDPVEAEVSWWLIDEARTSLQEQLSRARLHESFSALAPRRHLRLPPWVRKHGRRCGQSQSWRRWTCQPSLLSNTSKTND
jgi:hypothetical protein